MFFVPYKTAKPENVTHPDLLRDHYYANCLKGTAKVKCGKMVRRQVVSCISIPCNLANFLRVNANKIELFRFLSDVFYSSFNYGDKKMVVTDG